MNEVATPPPPPTYGSPRRRPAWVTALFVLLGIFLVLALIAFFAWRHYFHAKTYKPVELTPKEQVVLHEKLEVLDAADIYVPESASEDRGVIVGEVDPEATPDEQLDEMLKDDPRSPEEQRRIVLTEREANALLHKNTDLADRVKIKFEQDTIRGAIVIPLDEDFPIFGGKTFRGKVRITARMDENNKLELIIRDIHAMGIPIPKGWAEFKGVNLVSDPEHANPAVQKFASGIKDFRVEDGQLIVELNE